MFFEGLNDIFNSVNEANNYRVVVDVIDDEHVEVSNLPLSLTRREIEVECKVIENNNE